MIASAERPSLLTAARIAGHRAVAVCFTIMAALGCWVAIMMAAPTVEARFFPVVRNQVLEHLPDDEGGIAFYVRFEKVRDCYSLGRAWYAVLEDGTLRLVNAQYPDQIGPTLSRPVGRHRGIKTVLALPEETKAFFGVTLHQCGMPWGATRSPIGPFSLERWNAAPHGRVTPPDR